MSTQTPIKRPLSQNNLGHHQQGKTNLDFNEARDDGVALASAVLYANHLHVAQAPHAARK